MCNVIQMIFQLKDKEIYLLSFDVGNANQPRLNEYVSNVMKGALL